MVISRLLNGMILQVMVFFGVWSERISWMISSFFWWILAKLGVTARRFGHPVVCPNRWRFELLFQLPYFHTSCVWSMFRIIHQGSTDSSNEVVNNIYVKYRWCFSKIWLSSWDIFLETLTPKGTTYNIPSKIEWDLTNGPLRKLLGL